VFLLGQPCTEGDVMNSDGGKLQVCLGLVWRRVCSDMWSEAETRVACRQVRGLNYTGKNYLVIQIPYI